MGCCCTTQGLHSVWRFAYCMVAVCQQKRRIPKTLLKTQWSLRVAPQDIPEYYNHLVSAMESSHKLKYMNAHSLPCWCQTRNGLHLVPGTDYKASHWSSHSNTALCFTSFQCRPSWKNVRHPGNPVEALIARYKSPKIYGSKKAHVLLFGWAFFFKELMRRGEKQDKRLF